MDDITALHEAIEPVMARLAAGDRTAIWDLHRIAEPHLRSMLHHEARRIGVWLDDDDLAGLALDAAFEVTGHTARWEPGGNRAPAVTVGADHGMRPDAIRKVVQRVQQRAVPVAA